MGTEGCCRVELYDLPEDIVYVALSDQTKQKLFENALKFSGSWKKLGEHLGIPINKRGACKILESSRRKKIKLKVLKLLIDYLEQHGVYLKEEIKNSIVSLSPKRGSSRKEANCLFEPKLPFDFSGESGAIVISALLHDGGINSRLHPHYSNPLDINLRKKVHNAFVDVFGTFDFLRANPNKNWQLYFPKITGIILVYGLRMQYGRKVTNNPGVPGFIFDAPEKVRAAFLRQAFDDEACVYVKGRCISLKLASASEGPPQLLLDLQKMLKSLGVKSHDVNFCERYVDKKGISATKWVIRIQHQDNLIRFLDIVGFDCKHKKVKLKKIVSSLKQSHFALAEKPQILLQTCKDVQIRRGYITSAELGHALNRSQVLAKVEIRKLRKEGKLRLLNERAGRIGASYVLVEA